MLPIPILDDEGFRDITEQARSMIPRLCPQWTDFNPSDPGMTFLELFAFLKESQQYHLDQIGPKNLQKYLKLLGMTRRRPQGAETVVSLAAEGLEGRLPQGLRLLAGETVFETGRPVSLPGSGLTDGFTFDGQRRMGFSAQSCGQGGKLRLEVFGRTPTPGAAWYLRFAKPWAGEQSLYLWMAQDWVVKRNPSGPGFTPLAELAWERLTEDGWTPLQVVRDDTRGLLFSGEILLTDGAGEVLPNTGSLPDGNWLRVRLVGGSYDVPPVVTGLSDHMVSVTQRDTLARCTRHTLENNTLTEDHLLALSGEYEVYLADADGLWHSAGAIRREGVRFHIGEPGTQALLLTWRPGFSLNRHLAVGDGFPNQSYELGRTGQLADDFQLLIEEADRPGVYALWQRVEDLDPSGPEDRHYVLDEETGLVTFGDCIHGMAPEGEILIAGESVTQGQNGNVKSGSIQKIHPDDLAFLGVTQGELTVWNPDDAAGGRGLESQEDCFRRCRLLLRQTERAVTDQDYERLVRQTPGLMISNCKVIPVKELPRPDGSFAEQRVTVVVEPYSLQQERVLSPAYRDNILNHLEGRRMLGAEVALLQPAYIGITVYAEILSQPYYVDARARIQAAVEEFFRRGWDFGSPVRYSALYGIIDTLECVQAIQALTIDAQGRGISRGVNGDVILPHNGLAVLKSASYQVRPAE